MQQSFDDLLEKFLADNISPEELKLFLQAVREEKNADLLSEVFADKLNAGTFTGGSEDQDRDAIFKGVMEKARSMAQAPVRKMPARNRWMVAASIIALLGLGIYLLFLNKSTVQPTEELAITDVQAPAVNRAMITLSSGEKIYLDSMKTGTLITQSGVKLTKLANGQIKYEGSSTAPLYNTLTNPRGSQVIDMTLADGSRVWLNAGSSVTYPIAFTEPQRKVTITGEAYFEVAHNKEKPFIVSKADMNVQVLGTHFNVNAYDDESEIKVTLLEGSVKVANTNANSILKPGEQAQVSSTIKVVGDVDLEQVMAWKNGLFDFNKTEIGEIMRQLERWYDMQVVYANGKPKITLSGNISRHINASKVLEMLQMSGVHFTIEGKKIIVKQ